MPRKKVETKKKNNKTRKTSTKAMKVTRAERKELEKTALCFGISEKDMADILANSTIKEQHELIKELTDQLPRDEAIVTSKDPKCNNIVVQNVRSRHEHSPFVLNLKKMAQEREEKIKRKQFVVERLRKFSHPIEASTRIIQDKAEKYTPSKNIVTAKPDNKKAKRQKPTKFISDQFNKGPLLRLPALWMKPALAFAIVAVLVILPIKGFTYVNDLIDSKDKVVAASEQALDDLKTAGQSLSEKDILSASEKFAKAEINFESASDELKNVNSYLVAAIKIVPKAGKYFTDAERLTEAGMQSAELGQEMTTIFDKFYLQENTLTLTDKIVTLKDELNTSLLPKLQSITTLLAQVDPKILPEEKQAQFIAVQDNISSINKDIEELVSFSNDLVEILGQNYKRRYLFIFQNNNELRATGGFMGSMALVDIYNGKIQNIEIPGGGTYDSKGSLLKQVKSPDPLHLINAKWELQDANWFADFPTTAKKIQWFYENSDGPSVDGVIAINATLLEKILESTQPIAMPEYGKTITPDNFIAETQKSVEVEYDKIENKPKQFIADLAPKLLEQVFNSQQTDLVTLVTTLKNGLKEKEIQLYFNNENWQQRIKNYDWSGEVKSTSNDYLSIINSNIAGGKTDLFIEQTIDHTSEIQPDGTIVDSIIIKRKHNGDQLDPFSGVRNVDYMRVYVPAGSQFISADGFDQPPVQLFKSAEDYYQDDTLLNTLEQNKMVDPETGTIIYTENDKAVFGNWTQTDPGEESIISLKYKLPFKIEQTNSNWIGDLFSKETSKDFYSIFYQKQSGAINTKINSKIILPNKLKAIWSYSEDEFSPISTEQNFELESDKMNGIIIQAQ
ncbi:hypothetical protein A2300_02240 [Candidatus Falkowbacteria bacterium RIFOXYB2_FULL_35_7]|uniref:DUF4012 domain-containing protein n=1 Tax=Candidatus Falkowbacteria bacterium RIFOXYC2_FULL_36_12 TaxID=1798002 RepID=A0A1F5T3K1_9BACT|nr:MAG: hypothetical protein A2300_02240 [Candidatus Falkowbacteria bacterium RIFOXYB2_FULL_35_7]OGF33323.1 MAG: hypothetical protein A2478_01315 [Candidatus Falkowbacteria bacterium RIFOXYC2_FULL_36_12]